MTDLPARVKALRAKMTPGPWSWPVYYEAKALLPELMDAYLEAVDARAATVKPLVWESDDDKPDVLSAWLYTIEAVGLGYDLRLGWAYRLGTYDTIGYAQAAAQADCDARIRSAIDMQPLTVAEAARVLLAERFRDFLISVLPSYDVDPDVARHDPEVMEVCLVEADAALRALAKGDDK